MNAHESDLGNQNYDISKKKKGEKKMDKLKENNKIKQVLLYKRNKLI